MSGLIERIQQHTARPDEQLRVLDVEGEETDDVLDALATDTRRAVFRSLFEKPGTASELAGRLDESVQNVHYHLNTLESAGLVEEVDSRYSAKGNEMTVYGPASDPIVLVGDGELRPHVQRSLADVVAGVGVLGGASLLVQWGAEQLAGPSTPAASPVGPASVNATAPAAPPQGSLAWLVFEVLEPGVLFFFACLAVVGVLAYASER